MNRFSIVTLFAILSGLVLAACGAQPSPTPTVTAALPVSPAGQGASAACSTDTYALPSEFRSDSPSKLASTKPKLVEFFAFW